ncbi:MAG: DUF4252 domain-containing protein [Xanthomonadales bacterium]
MKFKFLLIGLVSMLALPAMAQEDALKDFPGYVDFGELTHVFGEPTVQIAVGASLLGLVSALSAREDPRAAELFKRLHGVRVSVFENPSMNEGVVDFVKTISSKLSQQGWESVVTINSDDELVRIFMKFNGDNVEGITVMALEEGEAVFVNVIGDLKPDELGKVMENFDIEMGKHDDHSE